MKTLKEFLGEAISTANVKNLIAMADQDTNGALTKAAKKFNNAKIEDILDDYRHSAGSKLVDITIRYLMKGKS